MTLPHIEQMEMAVIGAVINDPDTAGEMVFGRLSPDSMSSRVYHLATAIHSMLANNEPVTAELVMETLRKQGRMRPEYGITISDCLSFAHATPALQHYVDALADVYLGRDIYQTGARLQQMSQSSDVDTALTYMHAEVERFRAQASARQEYDPTTLADILAAPDEGEPDWIIPDLLPASDRLLVTAEEGQGKSTFLRQIALAVALGIDPFEPTQQIKPGRALLVDCEVSNRQLTRALRRMYSFGGRHSHVGDPKNLMVESRQGGIDLCEPGDQGWLLRMIRQHQPTVVCLGPLYRMSGGDINDEASVRCWQRILEPLLEQGVSIVMEHHSPNYKDNGRRDLRPIGSSVIRRWFSQGIGVRGDECQAHSRHFCRVCPRKAVIEQWRGSRDETRWPVNVKSPGSDVWWLSDDPVWNR